MEKKMKHYSLTTIQARPLKCNGSSLNLLEDISCQRIRSSDWTLLLFVANIGWIAVGDDLWHIL
jgi:hypothetical protein